ncbi:MAG: hypothetical protein MR669_07045 [Selenomonadaceae bacterium]|nr:hypothetical protein [Selenomonadaceae bacterium]
MRQSSSAHIIPHEQKEGTKNLAYTDGNFSDKSKDDTAMRGTVKNGVMTIWSKRGKKKDTPIITVSVDEVNRALKKGGANSEYTFHQLDKQLAGIVPRLDAGKAAGTRDTVRQAVAEGQG